MTDKNTGSHVEGFFYNYDSNRAELKSAENWSYSCVFEKLLMETTLPTRNQKFSYSDVRYSDRFKISTKFS